MTNRSENYHWFSKVFADFCQHFRILVVRDRLDHREGSLLGVVALEDAGPDEAAVDAKLHKHRNVSRCR